jgi:hypothetical protein
MIRSPVASWCVVVGLFCAACGGTVRRDGSGEDGGASSGGADTGGSGIGATGNGGSGAGATGSGGAAPGGRLGAGGAAAGGAPNPTPKYDCTPKDRREGDDCGPFTPGNAGGAGGDQAGYPQGCNVTAGESSGFSPGPLTCSCSFFPNADGTQKPEWICAL